MIREGIIVLFWLGGSKEFILCFIIENGSFILG